ncbi:MAG: class I SAM-dependent methyltransferase [Phycisphaerae bacterium]|nr:class I SAM-dependent methyltransferase [Phycisphaerae bacterium]
MDSEIKNQQQIYDNSWHKTLLNGKELRSNIALNLRFLEITHLLDSDKKILEIGCGTGALTKALADKNLSIIGTDISQNAIDFGLGKYLALDLRVIAAEQMPFEDETFDIVISFDLLEHIKKVDLHLQQVTRILKKGGYYLFQTPNKYSNIVFETLKTRSFRWKNYHPSLQTAAGLKKLLSNHGFDCRFIKLNPFNDFTAKKLALGRIFVKLLGKINFELLPLSMQTNFYVVAHKR